MGVIKAEPTSSLIDVLDRVLDKGIVVDAWVRIPLVGIDLITVEARVVVASIDTYLKYAEAVSRLRSWAILATLVFLFDLPRWARMMIVIILMLATAGALKLLSIL